LEYALGIMRHATGLLACFVLLLVCASPLAADDTTMIDNDVLRIEMAVDTPHHLNARHRHAMNRVMIYLDGGDMTLVYDDGHKDEQHWKPGQVVWSPAGDYHTSEDVGSQPMHIVEVMLKKPGPATPPTRKPELDPVVLEPNKNILLFENDQVRVLRSLREPGETEKIHEHTGVGRAVVCLTDLDASVKSADGTTVTLHKSAGDAFWADGRVMHAATNTGAKKYELILVEVK
jgi:mannose-6-phosphate isomerase-like protein (cupin superfamily)